MARGGLLGHDEHVGGMERAGGGGFALAPTAHAHPPPPLRPTVRHVWRYSSCGGPSPTSCLSC